MSNIGQGIACNQALKLDLNKLRYHKKRHGYKGTATNKCLCNEDIKHPRQFFLVFPFYASKSEVLTLSDVGGIMPPPLQIRLDLVHGSSLGLCSLSRKTALKENTMPNHANVE